MSVVDIATTLVPGLILLLAVGLGGDAISRMVGNVASSRHNVSGMTAAQVGLRNIYDDRRSRTGALAKELAGIESEYLTVFRELDGMRKTEQALANPENHTLFEIGRPAAGCEGWYVKVLLRRKHLMFSGLGTTSTNSEAYRLARVAIWNVNRETARQFCVQRFSKEASLLSMESFRGKLMIGDV